MKAVAIESHLPLSHPQALLDVERPDPVARGADLLVEVKACGFNPVDVKVRARGGAREDPPRILGWDAAGIVRAKGPDAKGFEVGDEVYYAGDLLRPGSNAQLQTVDARLVGRKPRSLSFAEAAGLPLTTLTAWEALFERMELRESPSPGGAPEKASSARKLLIIGGAGGVGSIAIQLAKRVPGLHVTATASRPESRAWCLELGADEVIDHTLLARDEGRSHSAAFDLILCLQDTDSYFPVMATLVRPQGTICSIVETHRDVNLELLMAKSARFVWEFMFTRSMFRTEDRAEQGRILTRTAELIDAGALRSTVKTVLRGLSAANVREAHAALESGRTVGKIVLEL